MHFTIDEKNEMIRQFELGLSYNNISKNIKKHVTSIISFLRKNGYNNK
jgi:c-di-GMP-binding flagellar brake protein YcgR